MFPVHHTCIQYTQSMEFTCYTTEYYVCHDGGQYQWKHVHCCTKSCDFKCLCTHTPNIVPSLHAEFDLSDYSCQTSFQQRFAPKKRIKEAHKMASKFFSKSVVSSAATSENYRAAQLDKTATKDSETSGMSPELHRVKRKIERHLNYKTLKWSDNQITQEANLLSNFQNIKTTFFGVKCATDTGALTVVLHLNMINDGDVPVLLKMGARYLQVKYGVLHATLEIGESRTDRSILVGWDDGSLVIPREKDISDHFHFSHTLRLTREAEKMTKEQMIDKIVSTIVRYNTSLDYQLVTRNSQTFVEDVMNTIGATTDIGEEMQLYLRSLINGRPNIQFELHEDLDRYVINSRVANEIMTVDQLEFLVNQYQYIHGREAIGRRCRVEGCQLRGIQQMLKSKRDQQTTV